MYFHLDISCCKLVTDLFIFQITGLILVVTGGVIQGVYSEYLDFLDHRFFNAPVLLVIVGCIIFCVTFFGCCGAIKENHCMTMTFSILLALILLVELGAGIGAYMTKDRVQKKQDNMYSNATKTFATYFRRYLSH